MSDETGLTAKRDELLAEVKALKARLREVEAERDVERQRAEHAEVEYQRVTIDQPVEAMLADLFVVPLRHVMGEVREHFRFVRDDAGALQVRGTDGNPVTLEDGAEVSFEPEPIRKALLAVGTLDEVLRGSLASGGGGPGGGRWPICANWTGAARARCVEVRLAVICHHVPAAGPEERPPIVRRPRGAMRRASGRQHLS